MHRLHTQAVPAKRQYAAVAKAISQFEPVTMLTDPSVVEEAKQYLADAPNVTVQVWVGACVLAVCLHACLVCVVCAPGPHRD